MCQILAPTIHRHAGHAHRFESVVERLRRQLIELGLNRLRAAPHIETVIAVPDGLIERGEFIDMIDQGLRCRLNQLSMDHECLSENIRKD
jgi:hypothetical protein